ncbi:MAG: transposase, partial [Shimia sp.]|nr:transposase [Shimia sp.]
MLEVAKVFRRYGEAYLNKFGDAMLPSHRRALHDIRHCRTEVFGGH